MCIRDRLDGLESQSRKGAVHDATVQAPAEQPGVPLAVTHALPQRPQCATVTRRSASQPLLGLPSQSAKLGAQAKPQTPPVQLMVALARDGHAAPQRAQLLRSVLRLRSQPSVRSALQSAKPGEHVCTQRPPLQLADALS